MLSNENCTFSFPKKAFWLSLGWGNFQENPIVAGCSDRSFFDLRRTCVHEFQRWPHRSRLTVIPLFHSQTTVDEDTKSFDEIQTYTILLSIRIKILSNAQPFSKPWKVRIVETFIDAMFNRNETSRCGGILQFRHVAMQRIHSSGQISLDVCVSEWVPYSGQQNPLFISR